MRIKTYDSAVMITLIISLLLALLLPCLCTIMIGERVLYTDAVCERTEVVPTVAVLFTMHNTDDRRNQTNRVIDYYKNKIPKQCTFLVDSANHGVSIDKVPSSNQAVFDQAVMFPHTAVLGNLTFDLSDNARSVINTGPTLGELRALAHALDTLDFGDAKHIIKITTKYCISRFDCVLHNIEEDADIIVQCARHKYMWGGFTVSLPNPTPAEISVSTENTEVLGFKLEKAKDIIHALQLLAGNLESRIHQLVSSGKYKVQTLPSMGLSPNHRLAQRSSGSILTSL